jgi:hypothetical protein
MQNLKDVLKETKDTVLPPTESEDDDMHLLPGVNFIHGDIFDVVSTVRIAILHQTSILHTLIIMLLFVYLRTPSHTCTCTTSAFPLLSSKKSRNISMPGKSDSDLWT